MRCRSACSACTRRRTPTSRSTRCDLLVAVGARFDDRATGKLAEFCPHAAVIHIDVDAAELNKLRTAQLAMRADAREALERLLPRLRPRRAPRMARTHRAS